MIDEVTEALDPMYREVLDLRVEGHKVSEIARRLGRSKRTVERTLQGLRAVLRDQTDE